MKELFKGILILIASTIVFSLVIVVGIVFNLIYPFYMAINEKSVKLFFKIIWRLIDGTLAVIGNSLLEVGVQFDKLGNVWGEWLEDSVTSEEITTFGEKDITVSASLGYLQHNEIPINKRGIGLIKALNVVFREKKHTLGSWLKYLAYQKIDKLNLKEK